MQGLTLADVRKMSDADLVSAYDNEAKYTNLGADFFRQEIYRRDQDKQTDAMLAYTRSIRVMTIVMTIATIINVGIAAVLLAR